MTGSPDQRGSLLEYFAFQAMVGWAGRHSDQYDGVAQCSNAVWEARFQLKQYALLQLNALAGRLKRHMPAQRLHLNLA